MFTGGNDDSKSPMTSNAVSPLTSNSIKTNLVMPIIESPKVNLVMPIQETHDGSADKKVESVIQKAYNQYGITSPEKKGV